jgi:hypothetical protein
MLAARQYGLLDGILQRLGNWSSLIYGCDVAKLKEISDSFQKCLQA